MMKENIGNAGVVSSREQLVANKFITKFIETDKANDLEFVDTPENIEKIKDFIVNLGARLMPGEFSYDDVINELKKSGVIKQAPVAEKVKEPKEVKIHETQYEKLSGLSVVEIDETQAEIVEANLLIKELRKANIFVNQDALDTAYKDALALETEKVIRDPEYYYAFADAGLVEGNEFKSPREIVTEDLQSLEHIKKEFKQNENQHLMQAKQIATISERGIAYAVSELGWYGKNVRIRSANEFNDVKRGVDDFFEINAANEDHFMALGIDVTYRGLKSDQFKDKFFKLLQSIYDGYQTKVKYEKNRKGEMLKEFAVPKIVLYIDVAGVKELSDIVKNAHNPNKKEDFENSQQKYIILNQVVNSCKLIADFSEECGNNISQGYHNILNSIKELSKQNSEVLAILEKGNNDDEISKHMNYLIEEFKSIKKREQVA